LDILKGTRKRLRCGFGGKVAESKKINKLCEPEHGGCGNMMYEVDKNRKICTKCRNAKDTARRHERAALKRAGK
jgi:hypothetical protein